MYFYQLRQVAQSRPAQSITIDFFGQDFNKMTTYILILMISKNKNFTLALSTTPGDSKHSKKGKKETSFFDDNFKRFKALDRKTKNNNNKKSQKRKAENRNSLWRKNITNGMKAKSCLCDVTEWTTVGGYYIQWHNISIISSETQEKKQGGERKSEVQEMKESIQQLTGLQCPNNNILSQHEGEESVGGTLHWSSWVVQDGGSAG